MKLRILKKRIVESFFAFIVLFGFLPAVAMAVETYKFERMTPVLQQPWYFMAPSGLATDSKGFIYVSDLDGQCVKKFTPDGFLVTKWGSYGQNPGEFFQAIKIAIDKDDYVYVADSLNHRIQKFTSDGKFISVWGGTGESSADGAFGAPTGLVVDNKNSVIYVADKHNYRVQKLTLNGEFISKWGTQGTGDGQFTNLYAIAIDSAGNVYVADSDKNGVVNYCIQKFSPDGNFLLRWGTQGSGAGQFEDPTGIFIDKNDLVYVTDSKNHRIQIFDANGNLKKVWGGPADLSQYQNILAQIDEFYDLFINQLLPLLKTFQAELHAEDFKKQDWIDLIVKDAKDGTFNVPMDMTIDKDGNIYVADSLNQRIQKFRPDMEVLSVWGSSRDQTGMFKMPMSIATDGNFFYVADFKNHRIQKFTKDGKFVSAWGKLGLNSGEFQVPAGIVVKNGYVYVADTFNHRIQKFTTDGVFVSQWGSKGTGNGSFKLPFGIAADNSGYIYVTDLLNFRIQKFTVAGAFVKKFESAKIPFTSIPIDPIPYTGFIGISIDNSGYIYTANLLRNGFQKFDSNGKLIKEWGTKGEADGQFRLPFGITAANGFIYVTDTGNCRIQQFDVNGNFLQKMGKVGSDVGQFMIPGGISLDSDGRIYVADAGNNRIQIFKKGLDTEKKMKAIIIAGGGPYDGNSIWNETQMNANFAYRALTYQGFSKDSVYYLSSNTKLDLDNDGAPEVRADATGANLKTAITEWAAGADSLVIYFVDHGGDASLRMSASEILSASDLNSWLNTAQESIPGTVTFVYDACYSGSFLPVLAHPNRIIISSAAADQEAWFMTKGSVSFSNYFWTHIFNGSGVKAAYDLSRNAMGYSTTRQTALLDDNGDGVSDNNDGLLAQTTYIGNGTAIYTDAPVIGRVSAEQTLSSEQNTAELSACEIKSVNAVSHVWAVIRPPDYRQGGGNPITDLPSLDLQSGTDGCYKASFTQFKTPGTYQVLIYARDDKGNTSVPKQTAVIVRNPLRHKAVIVAGASENDKWWVAVEKGVRLAYDALIFQKYADNDIYLMSPVSIPEVGKIPMTPTLSNLQYAITSWGETDTQDMVVYLIGNGSDGVFNINPSETLLPTVLNGWLNDLQNSIPGKVVVVYDACRAASFLPSLIPPSGKERIVIAGSGRDESVYFLTHGGVSFSQYFWNRIWGGATVADAFKTGRDAFRLMSCKPQTPYMDDSGNGIGNEKGIDGTLAAATVLGAGIMPGDFSPTITTAEVLVIGKTSSVIRAAGAGSIDKVWAEVDICASAIMPDIPITELTEKKDLVYNPISKLYEGTYNNFSEKCRIVVYAADPKGNISPPISVDSVKAADPPIINPPVIEPSLTDTVTLSPLASVSSRTASASGTATGDGITERGFYWWIEPGPATGWGFVSGLVSEGGSGEGDFSLRLNDLKPVSTYYIRAYVRFGEQLLYSEKISFTTPLSGIMGDLNGDTQVDLSDAILGLRMLAGITVSVQPDADVNGDGKIGLEELVFILQKTAELR